MRLVRHPEAATEGSFRCDGVQKILRLRPQDDDPPLCRVSVDVFMPGRAFDNDCLRKPRMRFCAFHRSATSRNAQRPKPPWLMAGIQSVRAVATLAALS